MIPSDQLRQATEILEPAKTALIVLPAEPDLDRVAAGLALYLALSATGKQVSVFCPSPMTVEFSHLVGVDKITNTIGGDQGKNLVISFPYQEGSIEKVSYNIEQDTFNLVIEPREGYPMITSDSIRFSNTGGGQPDLIITIGISKLADAQRTLESQASLMDSKPILAISIDPAHEEYGKLDIIMPSTTALSELMTDMVNSLSLRMDADIATNLLAGVIDASDTFSSPTTTAQTFETAALLSRSGARKTPTQTRQPLQQPPAQRMPNFPPQQRQNPQAAQQRQQPQVPQQPSYQQPPMVQQSNQPAFGKYPPAPQQQSQPPRQQRPFPQQRQQPQAQGPQQQQAQPPQQQQEAPADWLKPKIYKGSSLS